MLTRSESHEILVKYGRGALWTKHCEAVAEAAARVGQALGERRGIDQGFLWSAALLHDIGRCVTHDPILHGVEGYRLLMELHQPEEAFVCASHILFGLDSVQAARFGLPAQDFVPQTIEARLVALVDFLLEGERPTTLSQRFVGLRNRNAGNDFFLSQLDEAYEKASSLLFELSDEMGESVEDIVASQGLPGPNARP